MKTILGAALVVASLAFAGAVAPASAAPAAKTEDIGYTSQSTEFSSQVYYVPRRRYYAPRYRYVRPYPYYYGYPAPVPYPYYAPPRVYQPYGFYGRRHYW